MSLEKFGKILKESLEIAKYDVDKVGVRPKNNEVFLRVLSTDVDSISHYINSLGCEVSKEYEFPDADKVAVDVKYNESLLPVEPEPTVIPEPEITTEPEIIDEKEEGNKALGLKSIGSGLKKIAGIAVFPIKKVADVVSDIVPNPFSKDDGDVETEEEAVEEEIIEEIVEESEEEIVEEIVEEVDSEEDTEIEEIQE